MTWTPPPDVATVVKYRVALTTSAAGPGRQQGEVAVGTNRLDIPLHTPLGSFTHLPVSTVNAAGAQDTPVALLLVDHKPPSFSVSNLAFSDVDKRHDELSGTVTWSAPADAALVKLYRVYFAKAAGCGYTDLVQQGSSPVGWARLPISAGTPRAGAMHILVFTANDVFRPPIVGVAGVRFADTDADVAEIGGEVTWAGLAGALAFDVSATTVLNYRARRCLRVAAWAKPGFEWIAFASDSSSCRQYPHGTAD